jgi:hypothetical protein
MGVLPGLLRSGLHGRQHRRGAVHATKTIAACLLALAAFATGTASAQGQAPSDAPSATRLAGQGRLHWLGLSLYDARLWVGPDFAPAQFARHPFVLELAYLRSFRGEDIARRSLAEMRRAAAFGEEQAQRWESALRALLPDVAPGDRIAGEHRPGRGVRFSVNGKPAGELADPEFARLFFGIWLAPTTSEPGLRAALLGEAAR